MSDLVQIFLLAVAYSRYEDALKVAMDNKDRKNLPTLH